MNKKIEMLKNELVKHSQDAAGVEIQLQEAYNEVFESMPLLKEAVEKLEDSNEYGWDHEEIMKWIRFDASDFQDCKEFFRGYMRDVHCADVDFENDSLYMWVGPSIVINDDGDVYDQDSGKFFISKSDYTVDGETDDSKRNALIEAYMERTGCYPGVFQADAYGNVSPVNTTGK